MPLQALFRSSPPPPPIRAVRAQSQVSRAAGASRVVAWAGSPPGESWKREERGGQGRVHGGSRGG